MTGSSEFAGFQSRNMLPDHFNVQSNSKHRYGKGATFHLPCSKSLPHQSTHRFALGCSGSTPVYYHFASFAVFGLWRRLPVERPDFIYELLYVVLQLISPLSEARSDLRDSEDLDIRYSPQTHDPFRSTHLRREAVSSWHTGRSRRGRKSRVHAAAAVHVVEMSIAMDLRDLHLHAGTKFLVVRFFSHKESSA